jgi:hypothetical protein
VNRAPNPDGWRHRATQALVLLLAIALGARVAADLLAPLVPALIVLLVISCLFWILLRGRR